MDNNEMNTNVVETQAAEPVIENQTQAAEPVVENTQIEFSDSKETNAPVVPKKKSNIGIVIVLLIVFLVAGLGLGYYYGKTKCEFECDFKMGKFDEPDEKSNEEKLENSIKYNDIKITEDKIVEVYNVIIDNKKLNLEVEFTYGGKEDVFERSLLQAKIGKTMVLNKFYNEMMDKKNVLTEDNVKNSFGESNFKFVKGEDEKTYLIILCKDNEVGHTGLMILNNKLEVVKDYDKTGKTGMELNVTRSCNGVEAKGTPIYTNMWGVGESDAIDQTINTTIKDGKLYSNVPVFYDDSQMQEGNYGSVEEREYTLKDDKLSYKVINSYKITNVVQMDE